MLIIFYNSVDETIYITADCNILHYEGKQFDTDSEDTLEMDGSYCHNDEMRLYTEYYDNEDDEDEERTPYIEGHLPFVFNTWISINDMTDGDGVDIIEFFKQFKDIKVIDAKMLNRFVLVPDLETF